MRHGVRWVPVGARRLAWLASDELESGRLRRVGLAWSSTAPRRSTLAAEVAQLDAARTALEIGALDEARQLVARYHREFPQVELATEARVIHIEVLSAGSDTSGVLREGARFLSEHDNDPHADRVRQLTAHARKP